MLMQVGQSAVFLLLMCRVCLRLAQAKPSDSGYDRKFEDVHAVPGAITVSHKRTQFTQQSSPIATKASLQGHCVQDMVT